MIQHIGVHYVHESVDQRETFRGICDFIRENRVDWRISRLKPWEDPAADDPHAGWIISTFETPVRDYCHASGLPTVSLARRYIDPHFQQVWHDDRQVARLAVEHLIQRGFKRFGWFGREGHEADRRRAGFLAALSEFGVSSDALVVDRHHWTTDDTDGHVLKDALARVLQPIGCVAYSDGRADRLLRSCEVAGISVPLQVGVVGIDDEQWRCEASFPRLTSVRLDIKRRGYVAASILAQLIAGQTPDEPRDIAPARLVKRETTGFAATGDPIIDRAVAFIHANASRDVRIDDVVQHARTSRRTLSARFRKVLDTSPHQWILKERVEVIKDLLLTTDFNTDALTDAAGFVSTSHMSRVFREATGMTLIEYRNAANT